MYVGKLLVAVDGIEQRGVVPLADHGERLLRVDAQERTRRIEPSVFDNYIRACIDAGFSLRLEHKVSDAQTQALAIAAGLGVGLSGDHLALRFPELVYVPVEPAISVAEIAALWFESRLTICLEPFLGDL